MWMLALRNTTAVLSVLGKNVALEDHHLVEMRCDRTGRTQAGDAAAEDNRPLSKGHL